MLQTVGLKIITNAKLNKLKYSYASSSAIKHGYGWGSYHAEDGAKGAKSSPRVRSYFPETWIWEDFEDFGNGSLILNRTVPDTITSWEVSAFQINGNRGLRLGRGSANVTIFRGFWIELNLPYDVVQGEVLHVQVGVYSKDRNFKELMT